MDLEEPDTPLLDSVATGSNSFPRSGLLELPQEIRDLILSILLRDVPVFITQWTCSRSAIAHLQGLTTRIGFVEHTSSASLSLDFFARSTLLQINRQLRLEAAEVLRMVGYRIYVAAHCRQVESFLLLSSVNLAIIDALVLTDACRCTETSNVDDVHDKKYIALRDKVLEQMPRLRHVYLVASTTLAAVDLDTLGLYMSFLDSLQSGRLQSIYVECGTVSKGNYAADLDYERTWLLGPPRVRHRSRQEFYHFQAIEIARRTAIRSWLTCLEMPGSVDAFWPLPLALKSGLRFILQKQKPKPH